MSRKADFEEISGDISLLYELSLAVGGSLNINSVCDRFLKILMARKNLAAVEVWIKDPAGEGNTRSRRARLIYALPQPSAPPSPLPLTHLLFQLLRKRSFVTTDSSRPEFSRLLDPRRSRKGSVALFALDRIGVLKLYRPGKFIPPELDQLKPVIDNFAGALQGCLDHHRVVAEIRERKKTGTALRESEEKYRNVVELAQDGIAILQDGRVKFVNHSMARLAATSVKKMLGVPFLNYVAPAERPRLLDYYRLRLAGEKLPPIYETVLQDGKRSFPAEINAGLITFEGRPADLILVRDLTERKKMEEDILKARKLESLGVLAGGIAHDFNNILTGILGNISLAKLLLKSGEKQVVRRLTGAEKACLRARDLTRQLLTFSRGGAPIKEFLSLPEFLRETVEFALTGSRVSYRIDLAEDIWPVEADSGQLSQVIHNLIINAVQAMPAGGEVTLTGENLAEREDDQFGLSPGRYVELDLTDQGIGIPEEYLGKIFDPYFTTKQEGSGLGLATVYSIISKHKGVIRVHSQPGEGTTFTIYLPAAGEERPSPSSAPPSGKRPEGTIMLVDDEDIVREVGGRMLKLLGYQAVTVPDGKSALRRYRLALKSRRPFAAVILDLIIPGGMGGVEIADELRGLDKKARLIASSGYSNDPVISEFKDHGFDGALSKPYKIKELEDVLDRVLSP